MIGGKARRSQRIARGKDAAMTPRIVSMTGLALLLVMGVAGAAQAHGPARGAAALGAPVMSYDADGDGKVTAEEVESRKAARFAEADADGDGFLSAPEVGAYAEALRAERAARRSAAVIARLDQDGDGRLSAAEVAGMRPASSGFDRMLERLDADGDGALSAEELQAAKARRGGKGGERHRERGGAHHGPHGAEAPRAPMPPAAPQQP
jgi:hypothetical protein